ncbi:hypothetical protein FSP39_023233 [Pinctada imbricata]|uniref:Uncharacterized protein n=1 Tax=Pinctada imbricata TaxID=66713 RepID=A0AA88YK95_PINIB|nr:hypothetical protein FSP39_023233 [Pinctada imbricata]
MLFSFINKDLSSGAEHVCRHMAAMNLSQQSSLDSVGEPPGMIQTPQYIIQGQPQGYQPNTMGQVRDVTQYIIQGKPQGYQPYTMGQVRDVTQYIIQGQPQGYQPNTMGQPQFYQNQNIAGQPNVRYVYPVNYQVAGQGQGSQVPVATDNQNQTITQNIGQPFVTQYGPSCSGVPMPSAQNVDTYPNFSSQSTYSIPQSENLQNFQSSYPLPFSQSSFVQNPSQVFYSNVPCSQTVPGYSYGTNQGPYQSGTTPPSQQPPQPQSANLPVQTLQGQQVNVVPAVQTPSAPQFTSLYPNMQQQCQGQPQFRQSNPAVLQIPGVQQQHNLNLNPVGVSQTYSPGYTEYAN